MSILSLFGQASDYYTTYSPESTTTLSGEEQAGIFLGTMLFAIIIGVIAYVICALLIAKIFKKAGVESWKAWVPVYNSWVLLELGGQKGYWAVLSLVPIVNIVAAIFMYIAMYHIGLKLGKGGAFVLLAIFLPLIWLIWLAFDKSTWQGAPVATNPQTPAVPVPPTVTPPTSTGGNMTPPAM